MLFAQHYALVSVILVVAGCTPPPYAEGGAARQTLRIPAMTAPSVEPAPFVQQSRPAETNYLPVGVTPPRRALPARSAADAARLATELDAERQRSAAFARRAAPRPSYDGSIPPRVAPPPKELTPE